jgi:general secretion pathway protein L
LVATSKVAPMLIEALSWWTERMTELVPARLMRRDAAWTNAIVIAAGTPPAGTATIFLRRDRQDVRLDEFVPGAARPVLDGPKGHSTVVLRVPRGALLEKQIELPMAAERELHRVVGYEMNRLTPFEPDDVFWTWAVTRHDRARGRLQIRLSLVPKAPLLPLLTALEDAGLSPAAVEATAATGPPRTIPLQQEIDRLAWQRRATAWLAGACGIIAVAVIVLPFMLQSIALGAVVDRIAAVQPQVREVQALRQRIAGETAGRDAIAGERRRLGNTLEVLAAITRLLPDDTFLNDLSLRQRRLTISGQSAAAPKLIAGLASDPLFQNPGFAAPVTRNAAAGRDVFSINASVGP